METDSGNNGNTTDVRRLEVKKVKDFIVKWVSDGRIDAFPPCLE
jgi:hypothetical protein